MVDEENQNRKNSQNPLILQWSSFTKGAAPLTH